MGYNECMDHLGNKFKSEVERAKYWNLGRSTVSDRLNKGWSLEDALTTKVKKNKTCNDHLGNVFKNKTERAKYWNKSVNIVDDRLNKGWSLEAALTTPSLRPDRKKICTDHMGNKFESETKMCEFWDTTPSLLKSRLKQGWSLDDALTNDNKYEKISIYDIIYNDTCSVDMLSKRYKLSKDTIRSRLKNNKYPFIRMVSISFVINPCYIDINQTKYNLTVHKRIKKGKDVFECYIDNGDGTSTFKIMTYDMIDQYCLEQYKKLHNIV